MKKILLLFLLAVSSVNAQNQTFPTIISTTPYNGGTGNGIMIASNGEIRVDNSVAIPSGNGFTFLVTDPRTGQSGTYSTTNPYFKLSDVTNFTAGTSGVVYPNFVKPNNTYVVRVKINGNSAYPNYGNNCVVMTRPLVIANSGGGTGPLVSQDGIIKSFTSSSLPSNDQISTTNPPPFHDLSDSRNNGVVFRIVKDGDTANPRYLISNSNSMLLRNGVYGTTNTNPPNSNIPPNYFQNGSTYCIDAAVVYVGEQTGVFNTSNFGDFTSESIPACFTFQNISNKVANPNSKDLETSFDAIVSPNPSANNFSLSIVTENKSPIRIDVADVNGKIIEKNSYTENEFSEIKIGEKYKVGIYFVTITQNDNSKTLKLIKQ